MSKKIHPLSTIVLLIGVFTTPTLMADSGVKRVSQSVCRHQGRVYCAMSYYELISGASSFDGKKVSLVGYLGIDEYKLVLYPTEEAYRIDDGMSSIELVGDVKLLRTIYESRKFTYVRVGGLFGLYSYSAGTQERPGLGKLIIDELPVPLGDRVMDRSSIEFGRPVSK